MKKEETIQNVFSKYLKGRIERLEGNYKIHSLKLLESFRLIDGMKGLVSKMIDSEGNLIIYNNVDLNKSFSSVANRSTISKVGLKRESSRGKTPMKQSRTSVNLLDKSQDRSKPVTRKSTIKTPLGMERNKSSKFLPDVKMSMTVKGGKNERGISIDKMKRSLNRTPVNKSSDISPVGKKSFTKIHTPGNLSPAIQTKSKVGPRTPINSKPLKTEEGSLSNRSKMRERILNPSRDRKSFISGKTLPLENDQLSKRHMTVPNSQKSVNDIENEINVSKIITMDQGLDDSLINTKDDPLMLSMHDDNLDNFTRDTKEESPSSISKPVKKEIKLEFEEILEDKWEHFFSKFFTHLDLTKILSVSKPIGKYAITKLIKDYEGFKQICEMRIQNITLNVKTGDNTPKDPDAFAYSRGTNKAIELLNDSLYNKLFTETALPNNDILLVYMLYFQIINHPISKLFGNKSAFWKESCKYFLSESNGETGKLIVNSLKDLELSAGNLTKLFLILDNNSNKISPNYFSKICGTTGLIVFFVKDVLDYCGILCDKKTSASKSLKTYQSISQIINTKIQRLKNISNKVFSNC